MGGQPDLVYDVGLHDGLDTAYYLSKGLRVVAVDANPAMVDLARTRFAAPIAEGRLVLVPLGIASAPGTAQFWVSDDHTDWSSFDRTIAGRNGARHHPIDVQLAPFADVLEEHGLPRYCKIDIEGHDHLCLEGLSSERRPDYLSLELGQRGLVARLAELGYDRFKLIQQERFATVTTRFAGARAALPAPVSTVVDRVDYRLRGVRRDEGWVFKVGSSGPLPDRTRGPWLAPHAAGELADRIFDSYETGRLGLDDWFDIHASDARVVG